MASSFLSKDWRSLSSYAGSWLLVLRQGVSQGEKLPSLDGRGWEKVKSE